MSEINIYRCDDFDYINKVILSDEMWGRVSDDYAVRSPDTIKALNSTWLVCVNNGVNAGLMSISQETATTLSIHIYIEKEFRGRQSKDFGIAFLKWLKCNCSSRVLKLNTKIPTNRKDVIRFAKSVGLKAEGIDTSSIVINGKPIDRACLGLKISEI